MGTITSSQMSPCSSAICSGSLLWPHLLHWDGVAIGEASEDHHRCLCGEDDKRPEVDSANFPQFHPCHSLPGCKCFGQTVEKGPGWGTRIESLRMVVQSIFIQNIFP